MIFRKRADATAVTWGGVFRAIAPTVCILALGFGVASSAYAQGTDPEKIYAGMRWRFVGPYTGGRVTAVAGIPSQPNTFYAGASGGGLWRTEDAGDSWTPLFDKEPVSSIGAIAIAPSDPKVIYVGTGEYDMRSSIIVGNGVYKSTDGGKTWVHIGLNDSQQIGRIVVDPNNSDLVYVAALGHPYGPNTTRGVFRSSDGGKSWQRILYKNADTGAIDLAIDPNDSKTIYASLWQVRRPPWSVYAPASGPGSGLYKSTNGGDTWRQLTNGLPDQEIGKIGIAAAATTPTRLYVIIDERIKGQAVYRSDDAGTTWRLMLKDFGTVRGLGWYVYNRGWYFNGIAVDPSNPETVYVDTFALTKSTDGGKHFAVIAHWPPYEAIADCHQTWLNPNAPDHMIIGCDRGAFVTTDGGLHWSSRFTEPFGQFYRVATDNAYPYNIMGAQQDSDAVRTPSRTDYGAIDLHDITYAGGESGYITPDPRDPDIVYDSAGPRLDFSLGCATCQGGSYYMPDLVYPKMTTRSTWTLPLVFSMADPRAMYISHQALFRSIDGGKSWQQISPDLTRPNPGSPPNLNAVTIADRNTMSNRQGVIYSIAPSPLRSALIWAGTDDGKIWVTRDQGEHWSDVTPPALTAWSKVTMIEASPHDPATAYAAIDRHRLDDFRPYLYQTHNYGKTWSVTVTGIPDGSFINSIREDPLQRGLLFAATETAAYASFDNGSMWHDLRLNMPAVSVRDLTIHGDDLIVATHGRAFWSLDDITPLRQLAKGPITAAYLFKPEVAHMYKPGVDVWTEQFYDLPRGENPPGGALIDYYLPADANHVTLEIRDKVGHLVNSYSNINSNNNIAATAGLHRFAWNMHYRPPSVSSLDFSPFFQLGPSAPPGAYSVRFIDDGVVVTQPLVIRKDPRNKASQADLQSEFAFAEQVIGLHTQVMTLWKRAQAAKFRSIVVGARDITTELDALSNAIESIASAPFPDWRLSFSMQRAAFAKLSARFSRLSEQPPTP